MFSDRSVKILGALLFAGMISLFANAAAPRPVCACTTKQKTYATQMKAELRNLVTAQEQFFIDSSRYASRAELESLKLWPVPVAIEVISLTHSDSAWRARVQHRDVAGMQCWIAIGDASVNEVDGEPQCDPFPRGPVDPLHYQLLAAYVSFYLLASAIRWARAGGGLPPVGPGTYFAFFLLAVVHPFWIPLRTSRTCLDGIPLQIPATIMMGVIMAWMLIRTADPPEESRP